MKGRFAWIENGGGRGSEGIKLTHADLITDAEASERAKRRASNGQLDVAERGRPCRVSEDVQDSDAGHTHRSHGEKVFECGRTRERERKREVGHSRQMNVKQDQAE
jgi:hypothetical protein